MISHATTGAALSTVADVHPMLPFHFESGIEVNAPAAAMTLTGPMRGSNFEWPILSMNFEMNRWFGWVFTRSESAENHCQAGDFALALRTIVNWLDGMLLEINYRRQSATASPSALTSGMAAP